MEHFSVLEKDQYAIIRFPERIDTVSAREFEQLAPQWLKANKKVFIFDMKDVKGLSPTGIRPVLLFRQTLKKARVELHSINCSKEILVQLKSGGLDTVFSPVDNIDAALKKSGLESSKKSSIDVAFINPFLAATQNTLSSQASTPVEFGKPRMKKKGEVIEMDIAGVIALTSNAFHGSIALCFPEKVFLAVCSNMFGETLTEITRETEDAAGELLNIIFGQAKSYLIDKKGYVINKAIPTVIRGDKIQLKNATQGTVVILPFTTAAGPFHMEIGTEYA